MRLKRRGVAASPVRAARAVRALRRQPSAALAARRVQMVQRPHVLSRPNPHAAAVAKVPARQRVATSPVAVVKGGSADNFYGVSLPHDDCCCGVSLPHDDCFGGLSRPRDEGLSLRGQRKSRKERPPVRAALSMLLACFGAAGGPLDGTSLCRARSRQHPVASTCQPHQGRCWLPGDLGAAQTG